jgi:predicted esterase
MKRTKMVPAIALAIAFSGLIPSDSPATAHHRQARPDLSVRSGSVQVSGGQLSGLFVVHDAGRAVGKSSAVLAIRVASTRRVLARFKLPALKKGVSHRVKVTGAVPLDLPVGSYAIKACADSGGSVHEQSETNNCLRVGTLTITAPSGEQGAGGDTQTTTTTTTTTTPPPAPPSSVPTDPVSYTPDTVFTLESSLTTYWVDVPASYDSSNATPTRLLVWLHGCGGEGSGDIYSVSPGGTRNYISVAVGGREGTCWDVNADTPKVLAAIANIKTHFNIDPRRVVLGGYSSGGDLSYRTAFYNAKSFAGLLIENSTPFRDTGSTQSASLAAAAWKFNVVHLAHLQDSAYPIAGVRSETDAMTDAGFPMHRIEVDGGHYDDAGATENGHSVPGTSADLRTYLLPYMAEDWQAPAG